MFRRSTTALFWALISTTAVAGKFDWESFDEADTTASCSSLKSQCSEHCSTEATSLAMGNLAQTLGGYRGPQTSSKQFKEECLYDCEDSAKTCTERIAESEREKEEARSDAEMEAALRSRYQQVQSSPPTVSVSCEGNGTPKTIRAWPQNSICEMNGRPSWCSETAGVIAISYFDLHFKLSRISGTLTWWNSGKGITEEARCSKASVENYKF